MPGEPAARGNRHVWYAVAVLILVYTLSSVDRSILTLLVKPIKASLNITDTQISLLHGFAFAIFYTLLGVSIGRMADRGHLEPWQSVFLLAGFPGLLFALLMLSVREPARRLPILDIGPRGLCHVVERCQRLDALAMSN